MGRGVDRGPGGPGPLLHEEPLDLRRRVVEAVAAEAVVHDLPDDELAHYRTGIENVSIDDVQAAATAHVRPDAAAIVLVGDADAFGEALEGAGLGRIVIERDTGPRDEGRDEGVQEIGAVDEGSSGPTEGGQEPPPEEAPA